MQGNRTGFDPRLTKNGLETTKPSGGARTRPILNVFGIEPARTFETFVAHMYCEDF